MDKVEYWTVNFILKGFINKNKKILDSILGESFSAVEKWVIEF